MKQYDLKEFISISIFIAIIFLMAGIPQLGYISLPFIGIDITILFIPVLLGTSLFGVRGGIILGFAFGISSLLVAWIRPSSALNLLFRNPFISVLPRLVFPMFYLVILDFFERISAKIVAIVIFCFSILFFVILYYAKVEPTYTAVVVAFIAFVNIFSIYNVIKEKQNFIYLVPAALAIILHGFMVLSMIIVFHGSKIESVFHFDSLLYFLFIILATNTLFEAIFCSSIIQLITPTIKRFKERG